MYAQARVGRARHANQLAAVGGALAVLAAMDSRSLRSRSRGSSCVFASFSFISAMKRLGTPTIVSRPFLRRRSVLTASVSRARVRSEEHTSELQSHHDIVCRL